MQSLLHFFSLTVPTSTGTKNFLWSDGTKLKYCARTLVKNNALKCHTMWPDEKYLFGCVGCAVQSANWRKTYRRNFSRTHGKTLKIQIGLMAPLNHESRIKVNPHCWSCYLPLGSTDSLHWYFRRTSDHFETPWLFCLLLPVQNCIRAPFPHSLSI